MDVYSVEDSDEGLQYYIAPHDAAALLSKRYGHPIATRHISRLARRKKQPVRTYPFGSWQMYNLDDVLTVDIKKKRDSSNQL